VEIVEELVEIWPNEVCDILASCCRYTSLESQLSFQDYPLASRVITSEWFLYNVQAFLGFVNFY